MAGSKKSPVIVAELGRPETAAETAARKSETSRLYRQRKTVNNLVFSLIATLGVVLVIFLMSPQGTDAWKDHSVDVGVTASQMSPTAGRTLVAPEQPKGWVAKQAELRGGTGNISHWYIGYTTAANAYAAVGQTYTTDGSPVDESWISAIFEDQAATGVETIGGLEWTVYDHLDRSADDGNMRFGLQTQVGTSTLLVYGTDEADAIRVLAQAVAAQAADLTETSNAAKETP